MTGSVALKKCKDILNVLKNEKVIVDCILTKNAKKMIDIKKIKKNILGKVYFDYLDMKKGLRLDFNFSYNPSCSYNSKWTCPIIKNYNKIPFLIDAGEKKPNEIL